MAKAQRMVALKILPRRSPQRRGERGANAERAGEMSPNLPLRDLCDLRASAVKEAQVFRERTFGHLHRYTLKTIERLFFSAVLIIFPSVDFPALEVRMPNDLSFAKIP